MIGALTRRATTLCHQAAEALRRALIVVSFPTVRLGKGVTVSRGVVIKATDGGRVEIGDRATIGPGAVLVAKFGALSIGADAYVGEGSVIVCRERIDIGRDALIAEHVSIRDQDHSFADAARPIRTQGFLTAPIAIGSDVWLGAKSTITRGVVIGDGAVIGANSVVTKDIPPFMIAVGAPARILRARTGPSEGEGASAARARPGPARTR